LYVPESEEPKFIAPDAVKAVVLSHLLSITNIHSMNKKETC
jgi:hypothetical protein